jgi:hypothetical protein
VVAQREALALDLRRYGEHDLADRVLAVRPHDLLRIAARADHYIFSKQHALRSGANMPIAKALALATIDVLEGTPRKLRRKRRAPKLISKHR